MAEKYYLGVDVGSVSTNFFLMDGGKQGVYSSYLRTMGQPINTVKEGLRQLGGFLGGRKIAGVGVTGSGRNLA
ncbi:MAG TPA: 2-hydroxyglutaryl-CoA dehydratase, partial [Firmicutes bacterium]|nr:2-hydroxyglutaryl-CoA dehydratase [Bacillota bacterium]